MRIRNRRRSEGSEEEQARAQDQRCMSDEELHYSVDMYDMDARSELSWREDESEEEKWNNEATER